MAGYPRHAFPLPRGATGEEAFCARLEAHHLSLQRHKAAGGVEQSFVVCRSPLGSSWTIS